MKSEFHAQPATSEVLADSRRLVFVTNRNLQVCRINSSAEASIGNRANALIGCPIVQLVSPEQQREFEAFLQSSRTLNTDLAPRVFRLSLQQEECIPAVVSVSHHQQLNDEQFLVVIEDAAQFARSDEHQDSHQQLIDSVLSAVDSAIIVCNTQGHYSLLNRAALRLFKQLSLGASLYDDASRLELYDGDSETLIPAAETPMARALNGETVSNEKVAIRNGRSLNRWLLVNSQPILSQQGIISGAVSSLHDISEMHHASRIIEHQAFYDPLTELPNRRLLKDRLKKAIATALRTNKFGALLFIDLDYFKNINDSLGHRAGDNVLQQLGTRMKDLIRAEDTVARIGGDEFVILLPHLSADRQVAHYSARKLADKLREHICQPIEQEGQLITLTASVGLVLFPEPEHTPDSILQFADTAMYEAKSRGRDASVTFSPLMTELARRQLYLQGQLREALQERQFQLEIQPQIEISTQQLAGGEMLLRWHLPEEGRIAPGEFIPLLESNGMIVETGLWVINQACLLLRRWIDEGLWSEPRGLSVNISVRQLKDDAFVSSVSSIMARCRIPKHALTLEISEAIAIERIDPIQKRMRQLKELGVGLSLGYSGALNFSLAHLQKLPLDMVKINATALRNTSSSTHNRTLLHALISACRTFSFTILAEGVETADELQQLTELGCTRYQGFLYSRPLSTGKFATLLGKH